MMRIAVMAMAFCIAATASAQRKKPAAKKKVQPVVTVDPLAEKYEAYSDRPILKAMFTDSIRTTMEQLPDVLTLPPHAGTLKNINGRLTYENAFGDMRMYATDNGNGHMRIYQQLLLGKQWGEPKEINIDEDFTDIRSPWLMVDGQTLYFAARQEDNDNTSYCLYMSTLDTETGDFMKPQQMPLPFESEADDLYYIEDETDNLAWFVTTRKQEEGYVSLYTIQPRHPWEFHSIDDMSKQMVIDLAELNDISLTWPSPEARADEMQRVECVAAMYVEEPKDNVLFVINDHRSVTDISQLSSATSKALLRRHTELKESIESIDRELEEYRMMYHKSSTAEARKKLAPAINELEQKRMQQLTTLKSIDNDLRKNEG